MIRTKAANSKSAFMRLTGAVLVASGMTIGATQPSVAGEIQLHAGFFTSNMKTLYGQSWQKVLKKIESDGKGLVQISRVAGPETISRQQWCSVVKTGIIQLAAFPVSWCQNLIAGSEVLNAANVPPAEWRKTGAYEYMRGVFAAKTNTHFLTLFGWGAPHHFFLTKEVKSLADFKGLRIRRSPTARVLIQQLGADGVSMGMGQIYTAVQRGVVDGFILPASMVGPTRLSNVAKYKVDPGVYNPSLMILVNLTTWKKMDKQQKEFVEEVGRFAESQVNEEFFKQNEKIANSLVDKGLQRITLAKPDAERLVEMSQSAVWDTAINSGSEFAKRLKPLIVK